MSGVARSIFRSICGRTGRGVTGGAERSPWVTDIHNGISNPNFTYTGGQAIVPDENGILRRTPAGYPAVEGGAWSGTNWLPPTAGTTRNISTRKGLRTIQTSEAFEGMLIEPASTNKCTCVKANPTATTNIIKSGDAASVLSVVNDAAALAAAGLDGVCTSGNVYKLDNSAGTTSAYVGIGGIVTNLNKHSYKAYIRGTGAGLLYLATTSTGQVTLATSETYVERKAQDITPNATNDNLAIRANAGSIVYFILPQLEELPYCTSQIIGTDTAAAQTRAAVVTSAPTAGVFPSSGQDFAIFMRVVPDAAPQNGKYIITILVDGNNRFSLYAGSGRFGIAKLLLGVPSFTENISAYTAGIPLSIIAIQTSKGVSLKAKIDGGAWAGWSNKTGAVDISPIAVGETYQIGSIANADQFTANYPRTAIIAMPPKATLAEYQAWIEAELTLRGLI